MEQKQPFGNLPITLVKILDKYELLIIAIFVIGYLLKYFEIGGGTPLIIISLMSLGLLYFFSAQAIEIENTSPMNQFLQKLTYWSASIGVIGISFGINHFPGFQMMVLIAFTTLLLVLIISRLPMAKQSESKLLSNRWTIRAIIIGLISISFYIMNVQGIIKVNKPSQNQVNNTEEVVE